MTRPVREYLTDDCDECDMILGVSQGDNGDWYLTIAPKGTRLTRHCVRVTTSGSRVPGADKAVYDLWCALDAAKVAP